MRFLAIWSAVLATTLTLAPAIAVAESGEEMRARGEQLAKDGRYSEAIDAFKAAEKLEPRARHACLIALAYIRRELWPQAEIFLEQCETRATTADPVPEWLPQAKQQLAQRLTTVNVAPISIVVEPAGVEVRLAVSSFAPDELFSPRTIHLPPGRHVIIATAPGYNDAQKTVEVTGTAAQSITITMLPEGTTTGGTGTGSVGGLGVVAGPAEPPSRVPSYLMVGAAGVLIGGVASHVFYYRPARNELAGAAARNNEADYNRLTPDWKKSRNVTIGLYAVGGLALGTAIVLKYTVFKRDERAPAVSLEPRDGGGMLSVGWAR